MRILLLFLLLPLLSWAQPTPAPSASRAPLELRSGDRVVFLGDTLIEREQESGYLETQLLTQFPDRNFIVRNLGWSADTPFGESRAGFDFNQPGKGLARLKDQLQTIKPTVVFLGYGMANSFDDEPGLASFRAGMGQLMDYIEQLSGKSNVRFVILSPIRHESMPAPALDASAHNARLQRVTGLLRELASQRNAYFVDLFTSLPSNANPSLTDNGIHLTPLGYWHLAQVVQKALLWRDSSWRAGILNDGKVREGGFGATLQLSGRKENEVRFTLRENLLPLPALWWQSNWFSASSGRLQVLGLAPGNYVLKVDGTAVASGSAEEWTQSVAFIQGPVFAQVEQLRQAVIEKNQLYFYRWRPQNETYLMGFRKHEQGQNAKEIPMFDPLILAVEERINSLRQPVLRTGVISRGNTVVQVPKAPVLPPIAAPAPLTTQPLPTFEVAPGYEVSLFAENPHLAKPIQMNFDPQGRLWVASSSVYPQIQPGQVANDKILILEDTDNDGKADKSTVFAEGLLIPSGVAPGDGGVYVGQSTELLHFRDTDGDGRADQRRVVLSGFGTEDTHHILHTLHWGPEGQLYFNQSIYIHSHLETPGGVVRLNSGGIFNLNPATLELGVFLRGFCNPWGHQMDAAGQSFVTDGAGFQGISYGLPGAMFFTYADMRRELKSVSPGNYPKFCGLEIISSPHFPEDWQGNFITCDFRAHRVVRFGVSEQGAGYVTKEMPDLLRSTNNTFRPIDVKMGPDGALYIADWSNPIIQHGEVDFRDPRRDHEHGRIWRVTAKGRPLLPKQSFAQAATPQLFKGLTSSYTYERRQAHRVVAERGAAVKSELDAWSRSLSRETDQLEALWAYQSINVTEVALLEKLLQAQDPLVRAAAVRVLSYWQKKLPQSVEWLGLKVADAHPRVRLEAVRALGQVGTVQAASLALGALELPMDSFLDYALWLSINELAQPWLQAVESGQWSIQGRERQLEFALKAIDPRITGSLLARMLRDKPLPRDGAGPWIELIGASGGVNELQLLVIQTVKNGFDDAATTRALRALEEAARLRSLIPAGDLSPLLALFSSPQATVRSAALQLAGSWKLAPAVPALLDLAGKNSAEQPQETAFLALRQIGGAPAIAGLNSLVASSQPIHRRQPAAVALAALQFEKSRDAILAVLHDTTSEADALTLWRALLANKGVSVSLAKMVAKAALPEPVIKAGLRAAREGGKKDADLALALGLITTPDGDSPGMTAEQLKDWAGQVMAKGNAQRGELVYRRPELGCISCHAIGGAGAKVGPDLTSIGASAPVDYLVESVFLPNAKIKEGYHSVVVQTKDDQEVTGLLVRENSEELVLRDTANKEFSLAKNKVQSRTVGGSLMPSGLIDHLAVQEKIDLLRFLSELGKPGPYDASRGNVARVWRLFKRTTASSQFNEDPLVQGDFTKPGWINTLALVNGTLLQQDLEAPIKGIEWQGPNGVFAAAPFQTASSGRVTLKITGVSNKTALWLDGKAVTSLKNGELVQDLPAGKHVLVLLFDKKEVPEAIRAEISEGTFLLP